MTFLHFIIQPYKGFQDTYEQSEHIASDNMNSILDYVWLDYPGHISLVTYFIHETTFLSNTFAYYGYLHSMIIMRFSVQLKCSGHFLLHITAGY